MPSHVHRSAEPDIARAPIWFFEMIAAGSDDGFIELRHRDAATRKVRAHFIRASRPDLALQQALRLTETGDVWCGMTVRGRQEGKAESCVRANLLWADLDGGRDLLDAAPVPPSLLVESGGPNRYQAFWAVDGVDLTDPEAREKFTDTLHRLQTAVGSDPVADLPRVMRVPGSLNWKYAGEPMVVPVWFTP